MTIKEYASEMGFTVQEVLNKCRDLGYKATDGNFNLDDDAIIMLDNSMNLISTDSDASFEEIDAFSKLKLESEFQRLSPGGAISYIETPNLQNNLEAVIEVIKYIYNNIMYAELNTKSDYCQKCGFDGEIQIDDNLEWYCPNCGNRDHSTLNVARRTCGYIGSNFWNKGRTQEIKERVLHIDNKDDE